MREWRRVVVFLSCYLVLGIFPSSAQSVGESGPPNSHANSNPNSNSRTMRALLSSDLGAM